MTIEQDPDETQPAPAPVVISTEFVPSVGPNIGTVIVTTDQGTFALPNSDRPKED